MPAGTPDYISPEALAQINSDSSEAKWVLLYCLSIYSVFGNVNVVW